MNRFIRIVLIVLSLLMLAGLFMVLSTFSAIPWVSDQTNNLLKMSWFPLVLSIVVLAAMVLTLVLFFIAIAAPGHRNEMQLEREGGTIDITKKSIESAASQTLQDMNEVRRYAVHVKGNPKPCHLKLQANIETNSLDSMSQVGSEVQQRLSQELAYSLGVNSSDIKVKVDPFEAGHGKLGTAENPRVI